MKVLIKLFQKFADSKGGALVDPAGAKFLFRPFSFCQAFSFGPFASKEKAENNLGERYGCKRGNALAFTFPETGEGGSPIVFKARRMRLTHYEDGFLCGERFCINLIRHCGDTFPGLGEGQGLVASDQTPK